MQLELMNIGSFIVLFLINVFISLFILSEVEVCYGVYAQELIFIFFERDFSKGEHRGSHPPHHFGIKAIHNGPEGSPHQLGEKGQEECRPSKEH